MWGSAFRCAVALAAALAFTAPAHAAPPPAGGPVQLGAPNACLANAALSGCSADPFGTFDRPFDVELAPGGADVYVSNLDARLARFRRDAPTGGLTPAGNAATDGPGLTYDFALSPAGDRALLVGGDSSNGRATAYIRNVDSGSLSDTHCLDLFGSGSCISSNEFVLPVQAAFPPSGPGIYVATHEGGDDGGDAGSAGDGALFTLVIHPVSELISDVDCIPAAPSNCAGGSRPYLGGLGAVAVSPDGAHVYAGGAHGLVGFNRDPATGALAGEVTCHFRSASQVGCPQDERLPVVGRIVLSSDGEYLFAGGPGGLIVFDRHPISGALEFVTCVRETIVSTACATVPGFKRASGLALSPDDGVLYTAGGGASGQGELRAWRWNPAAGTLTSLSCVAVTAADGCAAGAGLRAASALALSGDGRHVYVAADEGTGDGDPGALASFRVERPPACQDGAVTVAAGTTVELPLACSDPDGDPVTRAIEVAPVQGSLGAVNDGAGTVAFTAAPGAGGPDSVTFTASDGTNVSQPATVAIEITPDAAVPSSRITGLARSKRARKLKRFRGTAADPGGTVGAVEIALVRRPGGAGAAGRKKRRCRTLTASGKLRSRGNCRPRPFLPAAGTAEWTFELRRRLPRGRYVLYSRATDAAGNVEAAFGKKRGNKRTFRLR